MLSGERSQRFSVLTPCGLCRDGRCRAGSEALLQGAGSSGAVARGLAPCSLAGPASPLDSWKPREDKASAFLAVPLCHATQTPPTEALGNPAEERVTEAPAVYEAPPGGHPTPVSLQNPAQRSLPAAVPACQVIAGACQELPSTAGFPLLWGTHSRQPARAWGAVPRSLPPKDPCPRPASRQVIWLPAVVE